MAQYRLKELADRLGADLIGGSDDALIGGVASIENAREGEVSFLANIKYRSHLETTAASAVIVSPQFKSEVPCAALVLKDPYVGFAKLTHLFKAPSAAFAAPEAQHPSAQIADSAVIGASVSIGACAVIGENVTLEDGVMIGAGCFVGEGCYLGKETRLFPNVTMYPGVKIGQRGMIHSGVVIGSDGFGMANDKGMWVKIEHLGSVRIGDDVEVGSNTSIDRGALNDTVIGNDVKLDNLIQVGHNVEIGDHTVIAGGVGIAGSTKIGRYCMIGGAVGIGGHLEIADGVMVSGMSMVAQSIDKKGFYSSGVPVEESRSWKKNIVRFHQLDEMARRIKLLEKTVGTLEKESGRLKTKT